MYDSPFDQAASPMWAVKELFANDFEDYLGNVESRTLFDGTTEKFLFDTRYYVRVPYKAVTDFQYDQYYAACQRKTEDIKAYLSGLTEETRVLFLRQSEQSHWEDRGNRIDQPEYIAKYATTETEELQCLAGVLKEKYPSLKFTLLHLNHLASAKTVDEANCLVTIPCDCYDYRDFKVAAAGFVGVLNTEAEWLSGNLVVSGNTMN